MTTISRETRLLHEKQQGIRDIDAFYSGSDLVSQSFVGMMMKSILSFVVAVCATVNAATVSFQSSQHQTALLELYTSEGCSSCPPAEAWLSKLKTSPGLWNEFVPVAFHISYWNNLGWKDKLSDERFSARQRDYAQLWSVKDIYTPEFVLNGKEWHGWSGSGSAPSFTRANPGVLQVKSDDGKHWFASFAPRRNDTVSYELSAAVLAGDLQSDVSAGENSGHRLNHDFAAISFSTHLLTTQTNGFQGTFVIAPQTNGIIGHLALAVWVTRKGQLEPLQATGGWLPTLERN